MTSTPTGSRAPERRPRSPQKPVDPALAQALQSAGQRMTRHRANVIAVLSRSDRPLTVDEVVERSRIPQSTAYRNLGELCEAGVAVRVAGAGRADRYEMSESLGSKHHHHHLVCTSCGTVADFDPSPALEVAIHSELSQLGDRATFQPARHVFDVHGLCGACA